MSFELGQDPYSHKRLTTIAEWKDFASGFNHPQESTAYLLAHEHFIAEMEEILTISKNPNEAQERFTKLLEGRKAFTAHGYDNLP